MLERLVLNHAGIQEILMSGGAENLVKQFGEPRKAILKSLLDSIKPNRKPPLSKYVMGGVHVNGKTQRKAYYLGYSLKPYSGRGKHTESASSIKNFEQKYAVLKQILR